MSKERFDSIVALPVCEGECKSHGECRGEVHRVHVTNLARDWGEFWYCERAIEKDRSNHFDVELTEGDSRDD